MAIPWLGRIMPNATENQILILGPFLQGGGSIFGYGVPKIHSVHPLRLPHSTGGWGCHHGGCGRSALRIDGCILPNGCSVMLLCQCQSLWVQLFQGCPGTAGHHSKEPWDQEKVMALTVSPGQHCVLPKPLLQAAPGSSPELFIVSEVFL